MTATDVQDYNSVKVRLTKVRLAEEGRLLPNGSRLSCGALKKDSFLNLRRAASFKRLLGRGIVQLREPPRRKLHSPRTERIMVTPPSAPSAQSVQTKKKPPVDTLGARRARGRHHDPLGTRTVELATRRLT